MKKKHEVFTSEFTQKEVLTTVLVYKDGSEVKSALEPIDKNHSRSSATKKNLDLGIVRESLLLVRNWGRL